MLDTLLLVVRKRPLTFLHVYHHAVVIPEIWVLARSQLPWSVGCVIMNAGVHIVMYYYFAAASTGRRIWWRRYVTIVQIAQFCTAAPCALAYLWFHFTAPGGCSDVGTFVLIGAFDGSLLLLFLRFFLASRGAHRTAD
uniref:Elongation of fatty acids protein n=1 Tax=Alexandrium catenella TaxID=2925 RepID=A0A7S1LGW8_ALECA